MCPRRHHPTLPGLLVHCDKSIPIAVSTSTSACALAGTIPPLLASLVHCDKSIPIAAVCVLSSLSDAGLSCEQLLQVRRLKEVQNIEGRFQ